jgi:hypothetical protein
LPWLCLWPDVGLLQRADAYYQFKGQAKEQILIPKDIFLFKRQTSIVEVQLLNFSFQATGRHPGIARNGDEAPGPKPPVVGRAQGGSDHEPQVGCGRRGVTDQP